MIKSRSLTLLIFFMILWSFSSQAQQLLGIGDHYSVGNVTISWSLGEISTNTISDSQYQLSQGFQQSSNLSILSVTNDPENSNSTSIYPNPTESNFFFVKRGGKLNTHEELNYAVINTNGQIVRQGKTSETLIRISTEFLSPGMYFVRLTSQNNTINQKIIIQ